MDTNFDCTFKIIIVGPAKSGKTSLVLRAVDNQWNTDVVSKVSAKTKLCKLFDKKFGLQIWDCSGLTVDGPVPAFFFQANFAIILYDHADPKYLDSVEKWLTHVDANCPYIDKLIVASKCDSKVSPSSSVDVQNFARGAKVKYMEISAKSSWNIDELFVSVTKSLYAKKQALEMNRQSIVVESRRSQSIPESSSSPTKSEVKAIGSIGRKSKLAEVSNHLKSEIVFKFVVCGPSNSGKSTFILEATEKDRSIRDEVFTKTYSYDGTVCKVQLVETKGGPIGCDEDTLRGATAILLLYDASETSSFDDVKACLVLVRRYSQVFNFRGPILLIANKCDKEMRVSSEKAEAYSVQHNMLYAEVSAKVGTGVKSLIEVITEKLMGPVLAEKASKDVKRELSNARGSLKKSFKTNSLRNVMSARLGFGTAPDPALFLSDPEAVISSTEVDNMRTLTFEFSSVMKNSEWSKPDKEGEVLKQARGFMKSIKTRWCILQGSKLFLFKQKPEKEDDMPKTKMDIHNGYLLEVETNNRILWFEVLEPDLFVGKKLILGTKSFEDAESWCSAIKTAIKWTGSATVVTKQNKITTLVEWENGSLAGLPNEWKQLLRDHALTEKFFVENPQIALQRIRVTKRSTPIVEHVASQLDERSFEEILTEGGSPDLYTDFRPIGSGAYGEVYEATDRRTGEIVAIKKMFVTPKRLRTFVSEISIQKSTQHPNIVKLIGALAVDTHIWIILEHMPFGNLTMVLEALKQNKGSMSESHVAFACLSMLKGLSYIHSLHRIHRDIKSDNLLIGPEGDIKIADFGNAIQLGSEDEKRSTMCGSPYWMAPEVILGRKYSKEVDIWSVGITLTECCDLAPPHYNEPPNRALALISSEPVPPLTTSAKWSSELRLFRELCLQRDPKARPEAIELLQHPFLRCTCTNKEFKETLLLKLNKKKEACVIQ